MSLNSFHECVSCPNASFRWALNHYCSFGRLRLQCICAVLQSHLYWCALRECVGFVCGLVSYLDGVVQVKDHDGFGLQVVDYVYACMCVCVYMCMCMCVIFCR